jgi:seryl-tRNA synthetase
VETKARGVDAKGLVRSYQFHKVELVTICHPDAFELEDRKEEEEDNILEEMCQQSERCLQNLGIPFRRILLCSGDTGFSARKTYDLELFLPSSQSFKEVSSVSLCGDFQARRLNMRIYDHKEAGPQGPKLIFPYTLNGSALAVGRTMVGILENYSIQNRLLACEQVLESCEDEGEKQRLGAEMAQLRQWHDEEGYSVLVPEVLQAYMLCDKF